VFPRIVEPVPETMEISVKWLQKFHTTEILTRPQKLLHQSQPVIPGRAYCSNRIYFPETHPRLVGRRKAMRWKLAQSSTARVA
jgi:hypothetical protein